MTTNLVKEALSIDGLLAQVPEDAKYLKVRDLMGQERWRNIEDGVENLHAADEPVVGNDGGPIFSKKRPGRPPKSAKPVTSNPPPSKVKKDPLTQQIETAPQSDEVLHLVMRNFAMEATAIEQEKQELQRSGRETLQYSAKRISALKAIGDTWLRRHEQLMGKVIDLSSPAFTKLFAFLLETFRDAMNECGVYQDQVDVVFNKLSTSLADEHWEQEAQKRMRT